MVISKTNGKEDTSMIIKADAPDVAIVETINRMDKLIDGGLWIFWDERIYETKKPSVKLIRELLNI